MLTDVASVAGTCCFGASSTTIRRHPILWTQEFLWARYFLAIDAGEELGHVQVSIELPAHSVTQAEVAVNDLYRACESLRTYFNRPEDGPAQLIHDPCEHLNVKFVDHKDLLATLVDLKDYPFDISHPHPYIFVISTNDERALSLSLTIPHILSDYAAAQLIRTRLSELLDGRTPTPVDQVSPSELATRQEKRGSADDRSHFVKALRRMPNTAFPTVPNPNAKGAQNASAAHALVVHSSTLGRRILELSTELKALPSAIVFAAQCVAISRTTGCPSIGAQYVTSNRTLPLQQTVTSLAAFTPVLCELQDVSTFAQAIDRGNRSVISLLRNVTRRQTLAREALPLLEAERRIHVRLDTSLNYFGIGRGLVEGVDNLEYREFVARSAEPYFRLVCREENGTTVLELYVTDDFAGDRKHVENFMSTITGLIERDPHSPLPGQPAMPDECYWLDDRAVFLSVSRIESVLSSIAGVVCAEACVERDSHGRPELTAHLVLEADAHAPSDHTLGQLAAVDPSFVPPDRLTFRRVGRRLQGSHRDEQPETEMIGRIVMSAVRRAVRSPEPHLDYFGQGGRLTDLPAVVMELRRSGLYASLDLFGHGRSLATVAKILAFG